MVVYDREGVEQAYERRAEVGAAQGNAAREYRRFLNELHLEEGALSFKKIDSHIQYRIDTEDYLHAVYNDLVDSLAKAETGKVITPKEDANVFRAIINEFKRFNKADSLSDRRKHARCLVRAVVEKAGGMYRPNF